MIDMLLLACSHIRKRENDSFWLDDLCSHCSTIIITSILQLFLLLKFDSFTTEYNAKLCEYYVKRWAQRQSSHKYIGFQRTPKDCFHFQVIWMCVLFQILIIPLISWVVILRLLFSISKTKQEFIYFIVTHSFFVFFISWSFTVEIFQKFVEKK